MKVALCDPDVQALAELTRLLHEVEGEQALEFEIVAFSDCSSCVSFMQQESVDILFAEMQMPEMDGICLAKKLRASSKKRDFALVFISAFNGLAEETYAVNTRDYLLKPTDKARLSKALIKCNLI